MCVFLIIFFWSPLKCGQCLKSFFSSPSFSPIGFSSFGPVVLLTFEFVCDLRAHTPPKIHCYFFVHLPAPCAQPTQTSSPQPTIVCPGATTTTMSVNLPESSSQPGVPLLETPPPTLAPALASGGLSSLSSPSPEHRASSPALEITSAAAISAAVTAAPAALESALLQRSSSAAAPAILTSAGWTSIATCSAAAAAATSSGPANARLTHALASAAPAFIPNVPAPTSLALMDSPSPSVPSAVSHNVRGLVAALQQEVKQVWKWCVFEFRCAHLCLCSSSRHISSLTYGVLMCGCVLSHLRYVLFLLCLFRGRLERAFESFVLSCARPCRPTSESCISFRILFMEWFSSPRRAYLVGIVLTSSASFLHTHSLSFNFL
jgi:hypothetical protein